MNARLKQAVSATVAAMNAADTARKWVADELDDLQDAYGLSRDDALSRLVEGLESDEYRDAMDDSKVKAALVAARNLITKEKP